MVRGLHAAGIEVLLDVVYNHTGEGDHRGPSLSFRGMDNYAYYKQRPDNNRFVMDYTGCGNTLDTGNEAVSQLIMDSLRYWVQVMGVDGFRFDLASVLARERYDINMHAAFFDMVHQDPVLSQVKLIAEPWDVGKNGYQLGAFPWLWSEWNDRFRDTVRRFWRGDAGQAGEFATRLAGSSDRFADKHRPPRASINYVTSHDGFTLEDLVSYTRKYNAANGEDNRDGTNHNYSFNCGAEGPSDDDEVLARRARRKFSMLVSLLMSQGVPMILGGDELSRTQQGNNNAYCQDNELSWYDWNLDARQEQFLSSVAALVHFRKSRPMLRRSQFFSGEVSVAGVRDVVWWHPEGREIRSDEWPHVAAFAVQIACKCDEGPEVLLLAFNAAPSSTQFAVPAGHWHVVIDEERETSYPAGRSVSVPAYGFMALEAILA